MMKINFNLLRLNLNRYLLIKISLIVIAALIANSFLASLLFVGWENIGLSLTRPWTIFLYLFSSQQVAIATAAYTCLMASSLLTGILLMTVLPGKYTAQRQHYGSYALLAIGLIFAFSWLWSELINSLFPTVSQVMPWTAFQLMANYQNNTFAKNVVLFMSLLAPLAFILFLIYQKLDELRFSRIHGNTRWATHYDLHKQNLFNGKGILVGEFKRLVFKNRLIYISMVSHGLVFAPSRSGKGVSQVIPNVLIYPGSMLIIDIKLEIFGATSGFRAKCGQQVFLFSPNDPNGITHCWNPLDFISRHPSRLISDLQLIIEILIPTGANGETNMWISEARSLALGLLLWLMDSDKPFTLGELNSMVKGNDLFEFLEDILEKAFDNEGKLTMHPHAYLNLKNFTQKAEKERSGVKSTLTSCLNLWDDPYINAATSRSDFDIREMRKKGITIYLGIPPNQLSRLAPLMNIFVQQFLNIMTENLPTLDEPHHVLCMLDEFCALGRMEKLREGFGFLAGFNVHLMAVIQNIGQFYGLYGKDKSDIFLQNTDYKIIYGQNTDTDRNFASRLIGKMTIKKRSKSHKEGVVIKSSGSNLSESYHQEDLLPPDEVGRLPTSQGIALLSRQMPIKFNKVIYYKHSDLKKRILPPIKITSIEPLYPTINVAEIKEAALKKKDKKQNENIEIVEETSKAIEKGFINAIYKVTSNPESVEATDNNSIQSVFSERGNEGNENWDEIINEADIISKSN